MDHLIPHLGTCAHYRGVAETHRVAIEYQEFGDERHRRSIDQAHAEVVRLVERPRAVPRNEGRVIVQKPARPLIWETPGNDSCDVASERVTRRGSRTPLEHCVDTNTDDGRPKEKSMARIQTGAYSGGLEDAGASGSSGEGH